VTESTARNVSSEDENLILVDSDDNQTGTLSKAMCHDGNGVLHRAFSVFLFDGRGRLLLQQRAPGKRLWPMFWSNSCCSHPRQGEEIDEAVLRRLDDELNTDSEVEFVYKFIYQASFGNLGSEHELCHVFLGKAVGEPSPNAHEIAATRYVSAEDLEAEFQSEPDRFTPWFRMEWERLSTEFADTLARYTGQAGR
jgi:isopentenyl-diphosphate delta-isomerase